MESLHEIDPEDLNAFLVESYEILNQFEQDILRLEKSDFDPKQINSLYRALHTIKGNCGFLPLPKLEAIVHGGETLLDVLRTTQQTLTPEGATTLLQLADAIRQTLQAIESTATEGTEDYASLMATLNALCLPAIPVTAITVQPLGESSQPTAEGLEPLNTLPSEVLDPTTDSTLRVSVDLLDHLMNLVGELVLARNRVMQLLPSHADAALLSTCQQIDGITSQLQDRVMQTRMQPISTLWRNLPRLVRETAIASGKEVGLELEGSDTELDRSLIAALKDPLIHLVRNCIDHGIEQPQVRVAKGKSPQGTIRLKATQSSGKVSLQIRDDGAGIDPGQIKTQAQRLGLITASEAEALSDRAALDLIFLPGFSTASTVTHLSGRGVGMDVVRRNLDSIHGTLEIDSHLGQGTTFLLKIPLTLAIMPAVIVTTGQERYAIPQAHIQELIRLEGQAQIERSIETVLNVPVYRLRGEILPLVNLASVLQLNAADADQELLYFAVIEGDGYRFGLIVDRIEDTQDIVVKPLSKQLKSLEMFAGTTVLGDGRATLILEVGGLAEFAGVQPQPQTPANVAEETPHTPSLILLMLGPQNVRLGICLTHATRLMRIPREKLEQIGEQWVMKYGDQIVSLIDVEAVLTGKTPETSRWAEVVSVVVITLNEQSAIRLTPRSAIRLTPRSAIGLIVHQILDIVEESLTVLGTANRPGIEYYATVQGQITEMLDLQDMINLANPYRTFQNLSLRTGS